MVTKGQLGGTEEEGVVKQEMLSKKKAPALAILFSTLLFASMLLFARALLNNPSQLVINELMADNGITIAGPDGSTPDWIELYNAGTQTVDLSGMYLTDDLTDPTCWQFLEGTTIGPGEYLLVLADRDGGGPYASFGLNANGEAIGLFDNNGVTLIDSVEFAKQIQDVSYGRIPDGGSSWNYLISATPGYSNQTPSDRSQSSALFFGVLIIGFAVGGVYIFLASKKRARANK